MSSNLQYNLETYVKLANRKDIQNKLQARSLFSTKVKAFLNNGNLLCFPTTPKLAPKIEAVTAEFLWNSDYYPKSMAVNAIFGLSNTPQITIPVIQSPGEVPIGLSFLAGYGHDTMLAEFCASLKTSECIRAV